MASSQDTAPASGHTMTSTTAQSGEKRKNDRDYDDVDQQPARKKMARRQCIVCADDVPSKRFPKLPHKQDDKDRHSSDVCFKCCSEHLSHEFKNKDHDAISCPQCSKPLEHFEVQKLASSQTYYEYLDKAAKKYMQQDEEFHSCPNAECPWGAFFAKDDGNIFVCRKCEARYCLNCEVPFHEDQSCEEYLVVANRRSEDEEKSLEAVKQISRPCPGPGCGVNIDKFDGCNHATCEICDHEFCWLCSASYLGPDGILQRGNEMHKDTCSRSPNRLPTYMPTFQDMLGM